MKKAYRLLVLTMVFLFGMAVNVYADDPTVYVTKSGWENVTVYHTNENCISITNSDGVYKSFPESEAKNMGFSLCKNCASGKTEDATTKNVETVTKEEVTEVTASFEDEAATASESKKSSKSSNSSSKSSNSNSSSKSSSDGKVLMTEKQRRAKFASKTNPKRGTVVATEARPANAGFTYADFGKYNSYASENKLGGTPIYLLGTVMDVEKVSESGNYYKTVILVNDCDGYQWYMRANVAKDKYDMMKAEICGKAGYIYGTYAGYSGVTYRPMMDMTMMIETPGNSVNMALYQ